MSRRFHCHSPGGTGGGTETGTATALALFGLFALALTGCLDSVGITCPAGQEFCNGEDFAVPLPPDLTTLPDLPACSAICKNGCCDSNGVCHDPATALTCGKRGDACVSCATNFTDTCGDKGCLCGIGAPCGLGSRCTGGKCVCDASTCTKGCCEGDTCRLIDTSHCADVGKACVQCDPNLTDSCNKGCACGSGRPCTVGQRCDKGSCVCDGVSCANGCCTGAVCTSPSLGSCGTSGRACMACEVKLANDCVNGSCQCGQGAACTAGQRCLNGQCVCDGVSCPMGCCDANGACQPGTLVNACGTAGTQCYACPNNQPCTNHICVGCNLQTCATGCCSGNTCSIKQLSACGIGAGSCLPCGPTSDTCEGGKCKCGGGPPCSLGLACQAGVCVCTQAECAKINGCCDHNNMCLPGTANGACGNKGAGCMPCVNGQVCSGGACACTGFSCVVLGQTTCMSDCSQCLSQTYACPSTRSCVTACLLLCNGNANGCITKGVNTCVNGCNNGNCNNGGVCL